jgi:hypothetical protein
VGDTLPEGSLMNLRRDKKQMDATVQEVHPLLLLLLLLLLPAKA